MKSKLSEASSNFLLLALVLGLTMLYLTQTPLAQPESGSVSQSAQPHKVTIPPAELGLIGPAQPPASADVVSFVKILHIHGISYEQARQFGPEAAPILLDLLADPDNAPYATNIVVTLGFLGQPRARQPLLDYLTQTQGEVSLDQYRGLLAVPFALAQLAHQGDVSALEYLLKASQAGYWNPQTLPWTFNSQTPAQNLSHQTLLALGVSGLSQAQARLEEITRQRSLTAQADHEVLTQALALNRQVQQEGMAPAVNPDPNKVLPPPDLQNEISPQSNDTNPNSHAQTFTIARHTGMGGAPTESQVDTFLARSSEIMQTADSGSDIGCCVALQRNGGIATFNLTDGTITTNAELNTVFGFTDYQVKIVPVLDWCGGLNPSTVGCAFIGSPKNMILEFLNSTTFNGILWAHEFGHNQGLQHPSPAVSTRIMNGSLSSSSKEMTQTECTAWHSTFNNPGTISGPCPTLFLTNQDLTASSVVTSGATITYVITIQNNTFNPVTNISVNDALPAHLSYVPGSATASLPSLDLSNFPTTTSAFSLNPTASVQITYETLVGPVSKGDLILNTATINSTDFAQPRQASHLAIVDAEKIYLPLLFK
ncbi:MAG: hypothetical protein U0401_13580 [Anaerolineae bacterium]